MSTETPTPRTDLQAHGPLLDIVPTWLARTLERELAAANAKLAERGEILSKFADAATDVNRSLSDVAKSVIETLEARVAALEKELADERADHADTQRQWNEALDVGLRVVRERDELRKFKDRLVWLHTGGEKDAEGYEWGVFRVKWSDDGSPAMVWQTFSDFSDLDAEMARESTARKATP